MRILRRIIRDPLTHFLAMGGLLFAVYAALHGGDTKGAEGGRTIVVDRAALLSFMQYQSAAFEPKYFAARLDALPAKDRKDLIDKYVREEALVREARAMGLDQGDYVIRRRMVQKMLYLIDDTATETFAPTQADLERYFRAHQAQYASPPTLTFTHVFVDKEIAHPGGTEQTAEQLKRVLEAKGAGFNEAPAYGDRFPYEQNYVQRTPDFIQSQFGDGFAAALEGLQPSRRWQGPIKSDLGYHLVLLTQRQAASTPRLADVQSQVKDDLLRDTVAAYQEKAVADLARRFTVKWKDDPKRLSAGGGVQTYASASAP